VIPTQKAQERGKLNIHQSKRNLQAGHQVQIKWLASSAEIFTVQVKWFS
jgi:cellobiose-specific phosphotransferase system component IIA